MQPKVTVLRPLRWILCLALIAAFALIALNLDAFTPLDTSVYRMVARLQSPFATGFFRFFTALVTPLALVAISLLALALVRDRSYWAPLMGNLALSVLLNLGLKARFTRPRPSEVTHFVVEKGYSFPSGHTMAGLAFFGFLIFLVWQMDGGKAVKRLWTAVLSFVVLMIALSRIYLGAHYFSDVLGGLCVSGAYLIVYCAFVGAYFSEGRSLADSLGRGTHSLLMSFAHAIDGVLGALKTERNLIIHFGAMALVIVFGVVLSISQTEWLICICLFALVLTAELINTAVETVVDLITSEYNSKAKLAKDTAAGAVLVAAICAAVAGAMIFIPKIYALLLD